jgi:thioredoxin
MREHVGTRTKEAVHMATVTITKENAERTVRGSDVVFLEFWASWCPSCRAFGPVYESAAERHHDLVFGTVNTEEQRELAGMFGIQAIPTVVAIKDNTVVGFNAGAMSDQEFADLIRDVREKAGSTGTAPRGPVRSGVLGGARPVRPQ